MEFDLSAFDTLDHTKKEEESKVIARLKDADFQFPHAMANATTWERYVNDDLYYLDKAIREILLKTRHARIEQGGMKTNSRLMFITIFGEEPKNNREDNNTLKLINRILSHYAKRKTNVTKVQGKRLRSVFHFTPGQFKDRRPGYTPLPISLKLRMEEQERAEQYKRENS